MVNAKTVVALTISAVVIIVLLSVAPMIGSTIEETYTVADTSADGWNRTANTGLGSPADTWMTIIGLIILAFVAVIVAIIIDTMYMKP
ncbi:MAG: hypothetical protein KAQ85_00335 [Thermodesulfovibrionia bacterium]|nr:hypothetical protein [Thermodesulfovibrionia bacterium]